MAEKHWTELLIKENQRMGLVFPTGTGAGVVFLRVLKREPYDYEYDRIFTDASVTSFVANSLLSNIRLRTSDGRDDILEVESEDMIYHLFWGGYPGATRMYRYYPQSLARGGIEVESMVNYAPYGFVDLYESPYDNPSLKTEMVIPYDLLPAFGLWNRTTYTLDRPVIRFHGMMYLVEVITNAGLISDMLNDKKAVRFITLGGIENFQYDPKKTFGYNPIPLGASDEEIATAMR